MVEEACERIEPTLHIGIETGGTSCKIALFRKEEGNDTLAQVFKKIIPTSQEDANETVQQMVSIAKGALREAAGIAAESSTVILSESLGVASFGPVCLDKSSPEYGNVTTTPKLAWQNFPLLPRLMEGLGFDRDGRRDNVFFETDCNVPAMFEYLLAKKSGDAGIRESLCYVTVGTGVGIGLIVNGQCVHGMMHPEGGHVAIKIAPTEKPGFGGVCSFHGDCLEGMCSNVSIKERLGLASVDECAALPDDHEVWDTIAHYLGSFCANLLLMISVERIIIGGGICSRASLMAKIRQVFLRQINGYVKMAAINEANVDSFIVRPSLDDLGALAAATCSAQQAAK